MSCIRAEVLIKINALQKFEYVNLNLFSIIIDYSKNVIYIKVTHFHTIFHVVLV